MKIKVLNYVLWIGGLVGLFPNQAYTQGQEIIPGPKGVYISTYKLYKQTNQPISYNGQEIIIYKKDIGKEKYEKVAEVSFPKSAKDFSSKLDDRSKQAILEKLEAKNIEEAYRIIEKYGLDTLKTLSMIPNIQSALGIYFIDEKWSKGQKVNYKIDRVINGVIDENIFNHNINGDYQQYTEKFKLNFYDAADSSIAAVWRAKKTSQTFIPTYTRLFVKEGLKGRFIEDKMSIVTERGDSLSCFFSKDVLPDQFFSWYLRPTDLVENLGYPSDTLHVLTVDVKNIEPIQKLSAKDTSGGLLIQWKPLPPKAYYTGIQILKSRTADGDYVVLDTLAPNETQYFDKRVILGSQYFYRVRPLLIHLPNIEAKAFTEVTAYVSIPDRAIPETPQGLEAKVTEKGVELKWNPNPDLNLFGYMVYRGTNRYNMEKIAWPIKAHSYTDTTFIKNYSGQYVYAISVMNQGQEMSDTSDVVSAFVRQAAVVESPGGLQAFSENDGINLEWQNTRVLNNTITGYIVYRRLVGEKYYTILNTQALPLPFYKDKAAEKGKNYEYAVSSIDVWGNQSILSPSVTSTVNTSNFLKAPTTLSVRNLQSGIEVSWPKLHETKDKRYVIYRSTDNNNFEKIATVDPQTFYLDKTVKMNTIYQYKVAILYNEIESETSQPVSIIRN